MNYNCFNIHITKACGFVGKFGKLARISGLDPAGPEFSNVAASKRLDKTDAKYAYNKNHKLNNKFI